MACSVDLRTDLLSGADTSGVWTLESVPTSFPVTLSVDSGNGATNIEFTATGQEVWDGVTHSDNPTVVFAGADFGEYQFQYAGGIACPDSVITRYYNLDVGTFVDGGSIPLCDIDAIRTILTDLTGVLGDPGHVLYNYSGNGILDPGYIPGAAGVADDAFDPSLATPGVPLTFTLNVDPQAQGASTLLPCCGATSFSVTYTITPAFNPGTATDKSGCS